ncbi:hypothetical protein JTE90_019992 [Oedothorax gibbosus]|uniref:Uncharacterized protein n=1 Tax=Oedothorax gibbosus TaxID=931172 RepID=A0AAV6U1V3_9ARAC|nr:hypothetical protein JTE90_019992 [Oedothorax gibbosus]
MKIKEFDPSSPKFEEVESLDDAEALVATYPNSSKAWILYIVWHLKQAEVNKARVVARRGLQTVNFREDKEKLNLWKALLNLENRYGTKDSLDKVLKEALQYQDQLKIYKHMLNLYISTEKTEELQQLSQTVLKKFKTDREVWITLGTYYMQSKRLEDARNLLARSLLCVPSKEHPDLLGKFAHLEYKHGSLEKSLSMYEEILIKYPKRRDLKSVYIQVLKSQGQEDRIKALL